MGINEQNVFEDFIPSQETPQIPQMEESVDTARILPEGDYNKKGELKRLRGRMLKKLLKYEIRALLTWLYICLGALGGMTALVCILFNLPILQGENAAFPILLISLLYVYVVMASIMIPFAVAVNRYHKSFFKEAGYLTFSIPASMEEHVFAKHVSGLIAICIGFVAGVISLALVYLLTPVSNLLEVVGFVFEWEAFSAPVFFEKLEKAIIAIEFIVLLFCGSGALNCWGQKFDKKSAIVWRILLVYFIFIGISSLSGSVFEKPMLWFEVNPVGIHVGNCLKILLYAGLSVFFVWYELRYLKHKLNLR